MTHSPSIGTAHLKRANLLVRCGGERSFQAVRRLGGALDWVSFAAVCMAITYVASLIPERWMTAVFGWTAP